MMRKSIIVSRPLLYSAGCIGRLLSTGCTTTFHKRTLPTSLIALSSADGKELFKQALATNGMEAFFPLAEQFITQSEPSFCALTSLAMVLNALNHDPKRTWKGVWRWITEETLQCEFPDVCGHSLNKVKREGMNFKEFKSLARCHGVNISSYGVREDSDRPTSMDDFRNFLGQTGDGHFSPIGGYHAAKDLVLVMDVARFKYPPFWVPLNDLWKSMEVFDKLTCEPRGYFLVATNNGNNADGREQVNDDGSKHHHNHSHCNSI